MSSLISKREPAFDILKVEPIFFSELPGSLFVGERNSRSRYVGKMTKPRVSFLISSTLLLVLWVSAASGAVTTEVFSARAFNERGELEYTENHTVSYENEKVTRSRTLYFDPAGRMIGELTSQYLPSPQFNTYSFKDLRAGYEVGSGSHPKVDIGYTYQN